jgi:oligopeptide/dipeptide ABC transporter ATP-binding protein
MEKVLRVEDFSLEVEINGRAYTAVDGIHFHVNEGEILGIVGESGCGKSLTALAVQGLLAPNVCVKSGRMLFGGEDLLAMPAARRREINGRDITMIFQEPMTSLNPLMKVGRQIGEVLALHSRLDRKEIHRRSAELLEEIGIYDVERILASYPHQLSGGMRQRVMIAMAVICSPRLLIADEPTTALDVTTQAHVLALLKKINREHGTSILFISHDIGVISSLCDRMLVMYGGKIMEKGCTQDVLGQPVHEYTKGLLNSIPTREKKGAPLNCIPGRVPPVTEQKPPCPFAPRCPAAQEICSRQAPAETPLGGAHAASCWNLGAGAGASGGNPFGISGGDSFGISGGSSVGTSGVSSAELSGGEA